VTRLVSPLLWAVVGALALWTLWSPRPEVRYDTVVVTRAQIEEREPRVELRYVDRIQYVTVEPEVVAESPDGGESDVDAFCATAVADAVRAREPSPSLPALAPPRVLLLRSGSLQAGRWFGADHLTLTGPTSLGGLQQQDYRVRGSYSWVVDGDQVIVRQGRWWWVREGIEAGAWIGAGWFLGRAF
jgi:hypothetical protein